MKFKYDTKVNIDTKTGLLISGDQFIDKTPRKISDQILNPHIGNHKID